MLKKTKDGFLIIFSHKVNENEIEPLDVKLKKILESKELLKGGQDKQAAGAKDEPEADSKTAPGQPQLGLDFFPINELDFFGYQYLYSFYMYLKSKFPAFNVIISNKSNTFNQFEETIGFNMEESNK